VDFLRHLILEKFLVFTLVLTRVSGLTMTAPIYGTKDVPMMVRALLAFALAVLVMPGQLGASLAAPGSTLQYLVLVAGEMLVGVCLGMGITVLLSGLQMAGELMSRIGGLTMSDVFDPTMNTDVPLFSRLLLLVSTAVFVGIGGHRMVMAGLLDTFQAVPPGGAVLAVFDGATPGTGGMLRPLLDTFLALVVESFNLGVRTSVPVVTAVLLATLVLGLIGRTLPQLNILMVGFGLNSMLTFAVLALSLGAGVWAFREQVGPTVEMLIRTMSAK
jgi:flagellar biosynthesis protein FliR